MVELLQSRSLGWEGTIAAAELIIANARYNYWFYNVVLILEKNHEKQHQLAPEELFDSCAIAVDNFTKDHDQTALITALTDANKQFKLLMNTPVGDSK
jgi:hypothetical protein